MCSSYFNELVFVGWLTRKYNFIKHLKGKSRPANLNSILTDDGHRFDVAQYMKTLSVTM